MTTEKHIIIEELAAWGIIHLNRVDSLNALMVEMINTIYQQVQAWQNDAKIKAIILKSNSPKAFCAGGDIRYLYESYMNKTNGHQAYFIAEYRMLDCLRASKKPIVALLDGYVLGGGFGLAQACQVLVASEKACFAMPETAIGFFPDVAATYFLSRLDDVGVYLATTGNQISTSDALYLDLIDYYVPSAAFAALEQALLHSGHLSLDQIEHTISKHILHPEPSEIAKYLEQIREHFGFETLAEIEQSLQDERDPQQKAWTEHTLATLQQRSWVAKKASLKLQHLGRGRSLQHCMALERTLQDLWFEHGDFLEGVRALIIDKDKQPKWREDNAELDKMLAALG